MEMCRSELSYQGYGQWIPRTNVGMIEEIFPSVCTILLPEVPYPGSDPAEAGPHQALQTAVQSPPLCSALSHQDANLLAETGGLFQTSH